MISGKYFCKESQPNETPNLQRVRNAGGEKPKALGQENKDKIAKNFAE